MTYPTHIRDLEHDKFFQDDEGNVAVNMGGRITSSPSGLQNGGVVTEVTLSDSTWTELPPSPLATRNAISIQNRSGVEIKINYNDLEVGYVGMVIPTGGERFYDITSSIKIFAKASSGSPIVNIEELG